MRTPSDIIYFKQQYNSELQMALFSIWQQPFIAHIEKWNSYILLTEWTHDSDSSLKEIASFAFGLSLSLWLHTKRERYENCKQIREYCDHIGPTTNDTLGFLCLFIAPRELCIWYFCINSQTHLHIESVSVLFRSFVCMPSAELYSNVSFSSGSILPAKNLFNKDDIHYWKSWNFRYDSQTESNIETMRWETQAQAQQRRMKEHIIERKEVTIRIYHGI